VLRRSAAKRRQRFPAKRLAERVNVLSSAEVLPFYRDKNFEKYFALLPKRAIFAARYPLGRIKR
jgi:hypothetical protein